MIGGLGVGFGDPVAARPVAVPGLFALQLLEQMPVLPVVAVSLGQPSSVLLADLSAHLGEPVILTCPSYGRVTGDGTAADPGSYDYVAAARDALHFAALFDRFIQNLRRLVGYDLQYFAAIEPQRRLAPHVHMALRGTVSRRELREVIAATYHQVWWPSTAVVRFDGDHLPVWDEHAAAYLDPETGEVLPTWDQALDAITGQDEPLHVGGSARSSTHRACSPDPGTPTGASAT